MKNLFSPWLTVLRTGATLTLTWIARIHSHTYIMWCEAPAQLFLLSDSWVFLCFCNPPNSDMEYRILPFKRT